MFLIPCGKESSTSVSVLGEAGGDGWQPWPMAAIVVAAPPPPSVTGEAWRWQPAQTCTCCEEEGRAGAAALPAKWAWTCSAAVPGCDLLPSVPDCGLHKN